MLIAVVYVDTTLVMASLLHVSTIHSFDKVSTMLVKYQLRGILTPGFTQSSTPNTSSKHWLEFRQPLAATRPLNARTIMVDSCMVGRGDIY